jgi:hypothetical protein
MVVKTIPPVIDIEIPPALHEDADLIFNGGYDVPMLAPPKTVLDIGANCGMFTVWAARRWPGARIHAYEPDKENFRLLKKNAWGDASSLVNAAVAAKGGKRKLITGRNSGCHSLRKDGKLHFGQEPFLCRIRQD